MSLLVTGEPMGQADPILGLMCGFLLLIVSGCALAALAIAGDRGIVNINRIEWIALMVIAFVCYGLWEHIEKLTPPERIEVQVGRHQPLHWRRE
jgi:hypothetical protein